MDLEALSAGVAAAVTAFAGGLLVPTLIARLPEPSPAPLPAVAAKISYADLAARPRLRWWCAGVAGALAAAMGSSRGWVPDLPVWVFLAVLGVALGYVDWRTQLLPARLVAPAYVVVGVLLAAAAAVSWYDGGREALTRAGLGWVIVFAIYFVLWFVHPRGLGYGDVRLSGVLGMALGWLGSEAVVVGTYAAFGLGAVVGGLLSLAKIVDRKGYPFGPFMLVGAFLGVLYAGGDLSWWR
ncbi:MAG: prepilin peptidase [Nocardioidaceae bacterium]|nr:prepilin peptidase [Nocardioidaceae bacterium]